MKKYIVFLLTSALLVFCLSGVGFCKTYEIKKGKCYAEKSYFIACEYAKADNGINCNRNDLITVALSYYDTTLNIISLKEAKTSRTGLLGELYANKRVHCIRDKLSCGYSYKV